MSNSRASTAKNSIRRRLASLTSRSLLPWTMNSISVSSPTTSTRPLAYADYLASDTQAGSQWDSLKHFAHQASKKYYNGLTHEQAGTTDTNGTHNWCERGGIVGRGVLCDWVSWYEEKNKGKAPPSPVSRHEIPIEEIEETLKWQGTSVRQGDILMIRSGAANEAERKSGTRDNSIAIGLQASEKTVRWLYDCHFAAVVGDTVAFEAWPPKFTDGWCLHEWLLVHWGMSNKLNDAQDKDDVLTMDQVRR
ncbi:hypothetical protein J1614_003078 [Plenodomus biglobosus]|nr:hypothetical protein J1614_003078 [Plenodomus biglobosus]